MLHCSMCLSHCKTESRFSMRRTAIIQILLEAITLYRTNIKLNCRARCFHHRYGRGTKSACSFSWTALPLCRYYRTWSDRDFISPHRRSIFSNTQYLPKPGSNRSTCLALQKDSLWFLRFTAHQLPTASACFILCRCSVSDSTTPDNCYPTSKRSQCLTMDRGIYRTRSSNSSTQLPYVN